MFMDEVAVLTGFLQVSCAVWPVLSLMLPAFTPASHYMPPTAADLLLDLTVCRVCPSPLQVMLAGRRCTPGA